jgi:L-asparagine transporter-like permease
LIGFLVLCIAFCEVSPITDKPLFSGADLLVVLNIYSTRLGAAIQTWSTVCKLAALFVIIVVGIVFWIKGTVYARLTI